MKSKIDKIAAALNTKGIPLFRHQSCYPENDAPRNLSGRTHYVDAGTLKYFRARILSASHAADGLLFWIVESVSSRPNHGGHTRRAVVFDVFGSVVNDRDIWHKTTEQAEKTAAEFVKSFDAVKHTEKEIRDRVASEIATAKRTLSALRGK